jgi:hypothetical protein
MFAYIKKSAALGLFVGMALASGTLHARITSMDALIDKNPGKDYRTVQTEAIKAYANVVVYIGKNGCRSCRNTMNAIQVVSNENPDVLFIQIDVDTYPNLKDKGTKVPKLHFHKNGCSLGVDVAYTDATLRALIKKYFR